MGILNAVTAQQRTAVIGRVITGSSSGNNRDISAFDFLTGGITLLIALWWAFGGTASAGGAFEVAGTLLFLFRFSTS